jgi:hypothetical protein
VKHKAAQYTIGKLGSAFCRVLVDAPPAKTPACVSDAATRGKLMRRMFARIMLRNKLVSDTILIFQLGLG